MSENTSIRPLRLFFFRLAPLPFFGLETGLVFISAFFFVGFNQRVGPHGGQGLNGNRGAQRDGTSMPNPLKSARHGVLCLLHLL